MIENSTSVRNVPATPDIARSPADDLLRMKRLYELSMLLSGDPLEVFAHIAGMIGELLNVKVVCLSEIQGDDLHFLCTYVDGAISFDAGFCPLKITPCATVEADRALRVIYDVSRQFPEAGFLQQHAAYSYCGFPAFDARGEVVAVTCLLHDSLREFSDQDQELLRILGQRIGLEIDRKRLDAQKRESLAALRASEQKNRLILDNAGDGIIILENAGRVASVNRAARKMFGYSEDEILGLPAEALFPDCRPLFGDDGSLGLGKARGAGTGTPISTIATRNDGSRFPVELSIGLSELSAWRASTLIVRDLTEIRRQERALRQALQEAEAANHAKTQFLANMSHELRTPLNAILGFSEIMRDAMMGPISATYAGYAADIHDSGSHLLKIINDILDLSKLTLSSLDLHEQLVDPRSVLDSCATLIRPSIDQRGLTLVEDVPTTLPRLRVDPTRIKQAVLNLLSNAAKFSHPGSEIELRVRVDASGLRVIVRDTGIGMDPADIPTAMEAFRQVGDRQTHGAGGTGLGLPLAKAMIEAHNGRLIVESVIGVGTTVTINLPPERLVWSGV